jgi:hypothetical protein
LMFTIIWEEGQNSSRRNVSSTMWTS